MTLSVAVLPPRVALKVVDIPVLTPVRPIGLPLCRIPVKSTAPAPHLLGDAAPLSSKVTVITQPVPL